jgi:outer membrane protein assembly factor BamB
MKLYAIRILLWMLGFAAMAIESMAHADWPSFRNGGQSLSSSDLPTHWSPTQGIAWQRELIGYGQSTPVLHDGRVYVASVEGTMKDNCVVQCLDVKSGQELWSFSKEASNKATSNYAASRAAPTPIVDSEALYVFFESGDVVAIDHSGKELWYRNLTADFGKFENNHGLGASPAQAKDSLIINVEHKGPSYLISLDNKTGKTLWKADRPSSSSWSSPIVIDVDGRQLVVVSSAGNVSAYDASNGEVRWELDGLSGNTVPSPTLHGSKLYVGARLPEFADENGGNPSNCCIDLAKMTEGKPVFDWRASKITSDYASPVVCGECVYYINKIGILACLDASTGKPHYLQRLGTQCWGTPIVSRDRIYLFGKDGKTLIIQSGTKYEVIATNELWPSDAAPKPETYVEGSRPERRSAGPEGAGSASGAGGAAGGSTGGGGGMMATLKAADKDGDGRLSAEEIPVDFKPMLSRIDKNGDGSIDESEMQAMAESFAARRASSASDARDPIVYGAIASDGSILIRTGTRIYCVR